MARAEGFAMSSALGGVIAAKLDTDLKEAAEYLAGIVKSNCPEKEGTMKNSVRVVKSKFPTGGFVVLVGGQGSWGDAYHTPFIELGTINIPAKHFVYKSIGQAIPGIKSRLGAK